MDTAVPFIKLFEVIVAGVRQMGWNTILLSLLGVAYVRKDREVLALLDGIFTCLYDRRCLRRPGEDEWSNLMVIFGYCVTNNGWPWTLSILIRIAEHDGHDLEAMALRFARLVIGDDGEGVSGWDGFTSRRG